MSAKATARIDDELYVQGRDALEEIGATQTHLISMAYRYVMPEKKLPGYSLQRERTMDNKTRSMDAAQQAFMQTFFEDITMPAGTLDRKLLDLSGTEYDALLVRSRQEDYENVTNPTSICHNKYSKSNY